MASKNTFRTVLSVIKSAPHALTTGEIKNAMGVRSLGVQDDINEAVKQLFTAGYLKRTTQKSDRGYNRYFTNRTTASAITAFIASGNISDLTGSTSSVTEQAATPRTPVTQSAPQKPWEVGMTELGCGHGLDQQYRAALGRIIGEAGAASWTNVPYADNAKTMCENLTKAGLTKEHRDRPGHYFTRKPNRELIGKFLARIITLEELFTQAKQPGQLASRQPRGYAEFESDDYRAILEAMLSFEHSVSRDDIEVAAFAFIDPQDPAMAKMIGFLKDAGLIKEDSQKANYWFTRKPNRDLIEAFLNDYKTLAQLFSEAKRPTRG